MEKSDPKLSPDLHDLKSSLLQEIPRQKEIRLLKEMVQKFTVIVDSLPNCEVPRKREEELPEFKERRSYMCLNSA